MEENNNSKKQSVILIEVVENGFIVKEDYKECNSGIDIRTIIPKKKVFNTKKQLNNYINDNL